MSRFNQELAQHRDVFELLFNCLRTLSDLVSRSPSVVERLGIIYAPMGQWGSIYLVMDPQGNLRLDMRGANDVSTRTLKSSITKISADPRPVVVLIEYLVNRISCEHQDRNTVENILIRGLGETRKQITTVKTRKLLKKPISKKGQEILLFTQ